MNFRDEVYRFVHYYFEQGGVVNVMIFIAATVMFYITIDKIIQFYTFEKKIPTANEFRSMLATKKISSSWPESFCSAFSDLSNSHRGDVSSSFYINRYREILIAETDRLDSGLSTLAVWINTAPLMGLFGTVIGMTQTFGVITMYGTNNPAILSEGISLSLITTQTGLLVAFPGLFLHTMLTNKKEKIVHKLINLGESVFNAKVPNAL